MTLSEMISDVRARAREIAPRDITDDLIQHWLNQAQVDVARRTLCLSQASRLQTIAGESHYELPRDAVALKEIRCDDARLQEVPLAERVVSSGQPTAYVQPSQNSIILSPVPDAVYELEVLYHNTPAELRQDDDVSDLPLGTHEALVIYATLRAYEREPPSEAAIYYTDRLRGAYAAIVQEQASRWRRKKPSQWRVER